MNGFVTRLRERERTLLGTWVKIPALETVELIAHAGFDYVVIDLEHSPMTLESAYRAIVVAQGCGLAALVRLPDHTGAYVQRLLDSGADGLLVPRVQSAAQARQALSAMIFAPRGERGMGLTSRAGRWGLTVGSDYLAHGDAEVLRCLQLEDLAVLQGVEQILGVPDLGAVFVGMGDLTMSSGLPATDPRIRDAVDHVLTSAAATGTPVGTAVGTADAARAAIDRGYAFVMVSNDASLFGRAATDLVAAVRG